MLWEEAAFVSWKTLRGKKNFFFEENGFLPLLTFFIKKTIKWTFGKFCCFVLFKIISCVIEIDALTRLYSMSCLYCN